MNVQPQLLTKKHCMMTVRAEPCLRLAQPRPDQPVTVLGVADGRILPLGEVP